MPDHRRKPVPEHEWAEHIPRIMRFIRDDHKQIKDIPELMKEYGLDASISQYERKLEEWRKQGEQGIRIKRTAKERRKVNRCIEERVRQGKESVVVIDGVVQSKEKTAQELARPQYRVYRGLSPGLPEGVEVGTPPRNRSSIISIFNPRNHFMARMSLCRFLARMLWLFTDASRHWKMQEDKPSLSFECERYINEEGFMWLSTQTGHIRRQYIMELASQADSIRFDTPEPGKTFEEDRSLQGAFAPYGRDPCLTWPSPVSSPGPSCMEQASSAAYGLWSSVWGAGDDFSG